MIMRLLYLLWTSFSIICSCMVVPYHGFGVQVYSSFRPCCRLRQQKSIFSATTTNTQQQQEAEVIVQQAECDDNDITYQTNLQISQLAQQSKTDSSAAFQAYELLQNLESPDSVTYNAVLKAFANSNAPLQAQELLEQMILSTTQPNTTTNVVVVKPNVRSFATVMDAWSKQWTYEAAQCAQELLQQMDNLSQATQDAKLQPNVVTYNTVIAAWANSGCGKLGATQATKLLKQCQEPDVISYNTVLLAWARSKQANAGEIAEDILRSMTNNVEPNTRTYTTVMNAYSNCRNPQRAHELLQELEHLWTTNPNTMNHLQPNTISYSTVMNAYATSNLQDKAIKAFELLQRIQLLYQSGENYHCKPSVVAYNSVLNACATTNPPTLKVKELFLNLYQELLEHPDNDLEPDHFTFGTMLKGCRNLILDLEECNSFITQVFRQTQTAGQVSYGVMYQLWQAASPELYKELIPQLSVNKSRQKFQMNQIPNSWRRNVKETKRSKQKYKL